MAMDCLLTKWMRLEQKTIQECSMKADITGPTPINLKLPPTVTFYLRKFNNKIIHLGSNRLMDRKASWLSKKI